MTGDVVPQTQITIKAHPVHWQDVLLAILKAAQTAGPVLANVLPAGIEEGITIAASVGPVVLNSIPLVKGGQ